MGASVYGISLPGMVNGVIHPSKVNGVPFVYGDPYWPVPGVTKPDHLYLFAQTQNYSDHGAGTALNLSEVGSGLSFSSSGLVFDGSSYAQASAASPDVNNIGATFSVIIYFYYPHTTYATPISVGSDADAANSCWDITTYVEQLAIEIFSPSQQYVQGTHAPLTDSVLNKVIYTQTGGVGTFYVNGSATSDTYSSMTTPQSNNTHFLTIGSGGSGTIQLGWVVRLAATLKGHAYTPTEVTAINAAMP